MEQRRTDQARRPPLRDDIIDEARTARATVSDQGVVTGWSEGARRLLGRSSEEVLGTPAARLLADDVPPGSLQGILPLPRWNGRLALRHRDGHRLEAYVLAHHGAAGASGGPEWVVVSPLSVPPHDPPDDTPVEWSFTQSPCCSIALYDTELRLRRANDDMQRVMDLTEDEMRGLRVSELVPGEEGERAEQLMARVLRTGEPQSTENYLRLRGETREHAWSVFLSPMRDADGALRGVCLTAHDISEQYWARRRLMLLNNANARIGSTLDVTRTAQELTDVAVPDFADFASVDLLADPYPGSEPLDPSAERVPLRRVALRSVLPGAPESVVAVGRTDSYPPDSAAARSLATGRPVLRDLSDYDTAGWTARDTARAGRIRDFGIHSALVVPLRARGTTLGAAVFLRHQRPDAFEEDDLLLAEEITGRAAVCIDNARRYTRERDTAVALQRTLLPQRLPQQAAVEVASRYLPAGAVAGVGGDWFDVIPLSGARVALVVGDVVGHGIHASATMGRLRTAVRTLADVDLPPDELLTHLDDLVVRLSAEAEADGGAGAPAGGDGGGADDPSGQAAESAGGFGATCLYAVYDPVSRYCTLARAGHPVPAVVGPDGTVDFLDIPAGPPLGLGGLPFESAQVRLTEGSLLVLYTNGLTESRHHDADEGLGRLRGALARPAPSLDALCDAVIGALPPDRPADDIALLIARTRALHSGQVAAWDLPADPPVVAQARKYAAAQLDAWGLNDAGFVTELVVSELVTNAIRHAEPPIQLRLIYDRTLICEVSDGSGTTPHARRARSYDEGGRGLMLVAQLTRAWGARQTGTGKTIWAEQTLGDLSPGG